MGSAHNVKNKPTGGAAHSHAFLARLRPAGSAGGEQGWPSCWAQEHSLPVLPQPRLANCHCLREAVQLGLRFLVRGDYVRDTSAVVPRAPVTRLTARSTLPQRSCLEDPMCVNARAHKTYLYLDSFKPSSMITDDQ